jgi:hypothetical protein
MAGLCQYRDAFGKPGEGAHAYRLGGMAAVDVALTVAAAAAAARAFDRPFALVLLIIVLIAVATHRLFCVNTVVGVAVFGQIGPRRAND